MRFKAIWCAAVRQEIAYSYFLAIQRFVRDPQHLLDVQRFAKKPVYALGMRARVGYYFVVADINDGDVGLSVKPCLYLCDVLLEHLRHALVANGVGRLGSADEHLFLRGE